MTTDTTTVGRAQAPAGIEPHRVPVEAALGAALRAMRTNAERAAETGGDDGVAGQGGHRLVPPRALAARQRRGCPARPLHPAAWDLHEALNWELIATMPREGGTLPGVVIEAWLVARRHALAETDPTPN